MFLCTFDSYRVACAPSDRTVVARRFKDLVSWRPSVLLVDDDEGSRVTFATALERAGLRVEVAATGRRALSRILVQSYDLVVVDLRLGDMLGTELVRQWNEANVTQPFVLISAFLTTEDTVEAMRLGARNVADGWMDVDRLVAIVLEQLEEPAVADSCCEILATKINPPDVRRAVSPLSYRCATWIVNCSRATAPFKTESEITRINGISLTVFKTRCHKLGLRPKDVRDVARLLWALTRTGWKRLGIEEQLDIGDERTERELLERAGIRALESSVQLSPLEFLSKQHFIDQSSHVLRALQVLLRDDR